MLDQTAQTTLLAFTVPSAPGNERLAVSRVTEVAERAGLEDARIEQLKTAVAEAVLNAIEHGNRSRPELPVAIELSLGEETLVIRITDQGRGSDLVHHAPPDLQEKLAERQSPRGWGLFLIESMVDGMRILDSDAGHTVELTFQLGTAVKPNSQSELLGGAHATE